MQIQKKSRLDHTPFPAHITVYVFLPQVLIDSFGCLRLLWLAIDWLDLVLIQVIQWNQLHQQLTPYYRQTGWSLRSSLVTYRVI